jgi:hypothetical protein
MMKKLVVALACVVATASLASNGTKLSVVAEDGSPSCSASGTTAAVTITTAVTSSGSAAAASVLLSTDGGVTFTQVDTVATGDWTGSGRTKTAEKSITVNVASGATTPVTICFVQPGSNGNEFKKACADLSLAPSCGPVCGAGGFCTSDANCDAARFCAVGDPSSGCDGQGHGLCLPRSQVGCTGGAVGCVSTAGGI